MTKKNMRIEKDSMGNVKVPSEAYYGAQTQRAIDNFKISNLQFSLNTMKTTLHEANLDHEYLTSPDNIDKLAKAIE